MLDVFEEYTFFLLLPRNFQKISVISLLLLKRLKPIAIPVLTPAKDDIWIKISLVKSSIFAKVNNLKKLERNINIDSAKTTKK